VNGAELVIQLLKEHEVSRVFGYPGGAIMPVYDALYDSGIDHVLSRHEQGAGFAAIGYASITGKPAVCIATSGPGATNLVTSLADAQFDSVPLLVITGQVSSDVIGTDAFQEIDMLGLSLAVTKQSFIVETPEQIVPVFKEAMALAQSGRPGPVLIDLPKDVQLAEIDFAHSPSEHEKVSSEHHIAADLNKIEQVVRLLETSEHPVFYIGGGVAAAKAEAQLNQLMDIVNLPVVSTLKGLGCVEDFDLYLGMLGMHGNPAANHAVQECDLLIAMGARFDDRVTGKLSGFATNAKVIHFDIDSAEINKLRHADISVPGDLSDYMQAMVDYTGKFDADKHNHWRDHVAALKSEYAWKYKKPGDAVYAPRLLKKLSNRLLKSETASIVATDVGQHQMWTAQHIAFNKKTRLLTSGGLGTMGFGLPVAIGAQFAELESQVIAVCGDGSFMMNIQELATIKRYGVPIKIILLDNQKLGMVKQWQQIFFDRRYSETDLSDNPDFVQLAKAFDIEGISIDKKQQVSAALDQMLKSDKAFILHVKINATDNVWPLVPPGATNEQMMEKIYDAYI